MANSYNAKAVAEEVIKTVRAGTKVELGKIQKRHGYSDSSVQAGKAIKTKTFKRAIKPLTDGLHREIQKIKKEMAGRDITEEKYRDLADVLDKLIKNYQLLSGGKTSNESLEIKWQD